MQNRIKEHSLNKNQIEELLLNNEIGTLSTNNNKGYPYTVPVHYVYDNEKVYIHGLPKGQKIKNIKENNKVCFTTYKMNGYLLDEKENPCDTNTAYESIVVMGTATLVGNLGLKEHILKKIVEKYTPHLVGKELPSPMVKGTVVIEIDVEEISGKYYK